MSIGLVRWTESGQQLVCRPARRGRSAERRDKGDAVGARAAHGRDPVGLYAADGEDRNRAVADRLAQPRQTLGLAVVGFGGGEITPVRRPQNPPPERP